MNYDVLVDLLVCNRVKSSISSTALQHVLSLESRCDDGWLRLATLVESLDLFYDTHLNDDKPRYTASAVSAASAASHTVNRVAPAGLSPPRVGFRKPNNVHNNHVTANQSSGTVRRCFICGSDKHLKRFHGDNSGAKHITNSSVGQRARQVNACVVDETALVVRCRVMRPCTVI